MENKSTKEVKMLSDRPSINKQQEDNLASVQANQSQLTGSSITQEATTSFQGFLSSDESGLRINRESMSMSPVHRSSSRSRSTRVMSSQEARLLADNVIDNREFGIHRRTPSRDREMSSDRRHLQSSVQFEPLSFAMTLLDKFDIKLRSRVELKVKILPLEETSHIKVSWFKDDIKLEATNSTRIAFYFNHGYAALIISGFERIDNGTYRCVASNERGEFCETSASFQLDKAYDEEQRERELREEKLKRLMKLREIMRLADKLDTQKRRESAIKRKAMDAEEMERKRKEYLARKTQLRGGSEPPFIDGREAIGPGTRRKAQDAMASEHEMNDNLEDFIGELENDDYYVRIPYQILEDTAILKKEKIIYETITEFGPDLTNIQTTRPLELDQKQDKSLVCEGNKEKLDIVAQNKMIEESAQQENQNKQASQQTVRRYQELEDSTILKKEKEIYETITEFAPIEVEETSIKGNDKMSESSKLTEPQKSEAKMMIHEDVKAKEQSNGNTVFRRPFRELEDSVILRKEKEIYETVTELEPIRGTISLDAVENVKEKSTTSNQIEQESMRLPKQRVNQIGNDMKDAQDQQSYTITRPYGESEDSAILSKEKEINGTIKELELVRAGSWLDTNNDIEPKEKNDEIVLDSMKSQYQNVNQTKSGLIDKHAQDNQSYIIRRPYRELEDSAILRKEKEIYETVTVLEPIRDSSSVVQEQKQSTKTHDIGLDPNRSHHQEVDGSLQHDRSYIITRPYRELEDSAILHKEKEIYETITDLKSVEAKISADEEYDIKSKEESHQIGVDQDQKITQTKRDVIDKNAQDGQSYIITRPYRELEDLSILRKEKEIFETVTELEPIGFQSLVGLEHKQSGTLHELGFDIERPQLDKIDQTRNDIIDNERSLPIGVNQDQKLIQTKACVRDKYALKDLSYPIIRPYRELEDSAILLKEKEIYETVTELKPISSTCSSDVGMGLKEVGKYYKITVEPDRLQDRKVHQTEDNLIDGQTQGQYSCTIRKPYRELEDSAILNRQKEIYETVTELEHSYGRVSNDTDYGLEAPISHDNEKEWVMKKNKDSGPKSIVHAPVKSKPEHVQDSEIEAPESLNGSVDYGMNRHDSQPRWGLRSESSVNRAYKSGGDVENIIGAGRLSNHDRFLGVSEKQKNQQMPLLSTRASSPTLSGHRFLSPRSRIRLNKRLGYNPTVASSTLGFAVSPDDRPAHYSPKTKIADLEQTQLIRRRFLAPIVVRGRAKSEPSLINSRDILPTEIRKKTLSNDDIMTISIFEQSTRDLRLALETSKKSLLPKQDRKMYESSTEIKHVPTKTFKTSEEEKIKKPKDVLFKRRLLRGGDYPNKDYNEHTLEAVEENRSESSVLPQGKLTLLTEDREKQRMKAREEMRDRKQNGKSDTPSRGWLEGTLSEVVLVGDNRTISDKENNLLVSDDEFEEDSFIYTDIKKSESRILDEEILKDIVEMKGRTDKKERRRRIIPSMDDREHDNKNMIEGK